jgi:aspartate kinase
MKNVIVAKFGGSSLANASQIKKVEEIIKKDKKRRFIVVSAPGVDRKNSHKITDILYNVYYKSRDNYPKTLNYEEIDMSVKQLMNIVEKRFYSIANNLGMEDAKELSKGFTRELKNIISDEESSVYDVVSRGENFNARLIAKYLGAKFIDATELIHIDMRNNPDNEITMSWMKDLISEKGLVVIPGFYANTSSIREKPVIKTFSRGGSDLTGAIVAAGINAKVYENWTDRDGVLCINPKSLEKKMHVKRVHVIDKMSFRESRELTYCGFSILNDETVIPLRKRDIPINIRNTNNYSHKGTMIVDSHEDRYPVRGIAGKDDLVNINIEKDLLVKESEFEMRLADILVSRNIKYDILSWIDRISVFVEWKSIKPYLSEVIEEINTLSHEPVEVVEDVGLIAIVGDGMKGNPKVMMHLMKVLEKNKICAQMLYQGPSGDIMLIVKTSDYKKSAIALYKRLLA